MVLREDENVKPFAFSCNTSFNACVEPPARSTMLKHWLMDLIGHVSGLSDAQLGQIEKSVLASGDGRTKLQPVYADSP